MNGYKEQLILGMKKTRKWNNLKLNKFDVEQLELIVHLEQCDIIEHLSDEIEIVEEIGENRQGYFEY